jgi:hypothetical protein
MTSVGDPAIFTVTLPDVWPDAAGGVVVPPVAGGVVVVPPCAPTLAVTVAVVEVLSRVVVMPFASVVAAMTSSEPAVVENVTGAAERTLPLMSNTDAWIVEVPPCAGTTVGLALTETRPTAAVPTAIFTAFVPLALAPPEAAVIVAVPFAVPDLNVATARPLMSVPTLAGSIVPSVVVKITWVPECGGVPLGSNSWATSWAVPFTGNAVVAAVNVITEPDGASNGTF